MEIIKPQEFWFELVAFLGLYFIHKRRHGFAWERYENMKEGIPYFDNEIDKCVSCICSVVIIGWGISILVRWYL